MQEIIIEEKATKGLRIALRHENQEVGHAYIYLIYNDLHKQPYALFEDLFVDEQFRGQGFGKQLIEKVIQAAKDNNCYKIIGTSRYAREAVHKMYERYGFKDYGKEFRMDLVQHK